MNLISRPVHRSLSGSLRLPGDKSISHRAAILGAMASGTTTIDGFLCADDTLATLSAMASLGAEVERDGERVSIIGRRLHAPRMDLDLGNSGTGLRLITGALCGHPDLYGQRLRLVGDASLSARPMGRIILPLSRMGARIDSHGDCAPLMLEPVPLTGAVHTLEIASAQVKSALLLAGIQADGTTTVLEPGTSRDHTERMLPAFGVAVQRQPDTATLEGPASLSSCHITVPGDLSSAAFPLAAALLVPGSSIELCSIGLNPSRDGLLNILKSMLPSDGFRIRPSEVAASHEPMGDLLVTRSQPLEGTDIPAEMVSLAIDEFPI
ncbi:MAG: 3-phosphoshikimate 1-carboxyvinyltransferase, partial [Pseudomonadota bacterium]